MIQTGILLMVMFLALVYAGRVFLAWAATAAAALGLWAWLGDP